MVRLHEPQGDGIRTDSGLSEGTEVGSLYDPMLSKVIAYGPDRATALRKLRAALADTVTLGVPTNAGFLRRLLAHPAVVAGELDTGLVEREADGLVPGEVPVEVYAAAALLRHAALTPGRGAGWADPFAATDGWRLGGERAWTAHPLQVPGHDPVTVRVRRTPEGGTELLPDGAEKPLDGSGKPRARRPVRRAARRTRAHLHRPAGRHLAGPGRGRLAGAGPRPGGRLARRRRPLRRRFADRADAGHGDRGEGGRGDHVAAGQSLLVVEAMKMEHVVSAPHAGTVAELDVTPGATVAMDQVLAVVTPVEEDQ